MPWFKVDDDLTFHRKVVKAGNAAMGLWVRAGAWSSQQLTDGFVPDAMIDLMGTPAQRRKLLAAQLWVEVDGGCMFYGWNKNGRQPSSQSVREKRADAARRQQEYRDRLHRKSQAKGPRNAVTDTSVTEPVTPVLTGPPTRPDPSTSDEVLPPAVPAADERADLVLVHPAAEAPISARDCTEAWVDEFRATGAQPAERQIKQAARESKQLLDAGNSPAMVLALARSAGSQRRATVVNEMSRRAPAAQKPNRPSTTDKIGHLQAMKTGTDDRQPRSLPRGEFR